MNQKKTGLLLAALAVALLALLVSVKAGIDSRDAALCTIYHADPKLNPAECPAHRSNTSWFVVGTFGIAFVILGSGLYFLFAPPLQAAGKKPAVGMEKLDGEEKKLYGLLQRSNGSAYQGDLVRESGFGKVRISRILDRMESKGVVERKRRGMTNIVVLK